MATVPAYGYLDQRNASMSPGRAVVLVTKANNTLPDGTCKALCVGTAGTLNGIDAFGNTVTDYPAQAGYNPVGFRQISTGGTADNIWAIY